MNTLSGCLSILLACMALATAPVPAQQAARIQRIHDGLLTYNVVRAARLPTLEERMRYYHVPGVSIAVIDGGRIAWARGWGLVQAEKDVVVDTSTLFQAASISKPVTAAAALRLVERGTLSLDEDVNTRLRSWHVPANRFTDSAKVTLRRLLSHSAGLTVHGFPGYARGAPIPSVIQVLEGASPANTRAVVADTFPGSGHRYSGGGYVVAQLLLTDVTGKAFPTLMRELVLSPAQMSHSTYEQPIPADRAAHAATAHDRAGVAVKGLYHTYPEMAAAGLWTTSSDLARFAIAIQRSLAGNAGALLSQEMARRMITPVADNYGLGFSVQGAGDSLWFSHGGSNEGFECYLIASASGGRGAVVMTNGSGGADLAMELLRSVAREYDWPILRANERAAIKLAPAALAQISGRYRADLPGQPRGLVIDIRQADGQLVADIPRVGWRGRSLRAAAPDRVFFLENPGEIVFERDGRGAVVALVVNGLGPAVRATRAND